MTEPTIIFEDFHLLALSKPPGLPTQAPEPFPSLERWAKSYIKKKYAKPAGVYLGIPHRLDRPVSGVVIFCRNTKCAQRVALQFQQHTVTKIYRALVEGQPTISQDTWRDYVAKIEAKAQGRIAQAGDPGAKEAITEVQVLALGSTSTELQLTPRTGRMHQLRLQAAARGMPIIGDGLYGSTRPGPSLPGGDGVPIIYLHAAQLVIEHPFEKRPLTLEAPLPAYWDSPRGNG